MSLVLSDLKYTHEHEWLRIEDNEAVVGITDHAQQQLGDIVFVSLPAVGQVFEAGAECAVVESVKAASDVYMPVSGEIIAVNTELELSPEQVNFDAYGEGWLFRIKINELSQINNLLDADGYQNLLDAE